MARRFRFIDCVVPRAQQCFSLQGVYFSLLFLFLLSFFCLAPMGWVVLFVLISTSFQFCKSSNSNRSIRSVVSTTLQQVHMPGLVDHNTVLVLNEGSGCALYCMLMLLGTWVISTDFPFFKLTYVNQYCFLCTNYNCPIAAVLVGPVIRNLQTFCLRHVYRAFRWE